MSTIHAMGARLFAALFVLLFCSTAFAGSAKVEVCHIPPSDPDSYHTIKVTEQALAAHLAHFDLVGPCNEVCALLCDDGNACTKDDSAGCEENGCPVVSEPVDCSDGSLCTDDLCDPDSGCSNPVTVTCEAIDLCMSSTCDPVEGVCEETFVLCDEGEECNPGNGDCEPIEESGDCPCFTASDLGAVFSCDITADNTFAFFLDGSTACSGSGCSTLGNPGCSVYDDNGVYSDLAIDTEANEACLAVLATVCSD